MTASVVGSWGLPPAAGDSYTYGTSAVNVATREHDWIIVTATWRTSQDGQAVCFIADTAHNVYQPAAMNLGTLNIQVWACPNAKAASKVYISSSAYVRDLSVTVLDVMGMGPGYQLDITPVTAAGTGSGWSMSATTTQEDFILAVSAVEQEAAGFTGTTWPGIPLQAGANQVCSFTGWVSTDAGTYTATAASHVPWPTLTNAYAGLMVAFSATASGVISSAPNPAWPYVQIQAAFTWNPGSATLPDWTDITDRFLSLNGQRGRSFELDELSAADLTLELLNQDGALTPGNTSGSYGTVYLNIPVRFLATWQARTYCVFSGLMSALPESYDFERGIVNMALTDSWSKLPQILLPSGTISELLYDRPLNLWPLNDQSGAAQASNWSGVSEVVLVPTNAKQGGGLYDDTPTTGFGNGFFGTAPPFSLGGTTDTTWGVYTTGAWYQGCVLVDRDDPTLPLTGTGATYEFMLQLMNITENYTTGAVPIVLSTEKGSLSGGDFFRMILAPDVGIAEGADSDPITTTQMIITQKNNSWMARLGNPTIPNLFDSKWHHYAVTFSTSGLITIYLDGVEIHSFQGQFPSGQLEMLQIGGDVTGPLTPEKAPDPTPVAWAEEYGVGCGTGYIANVAVYDRVLDPERILAHYKGAVSGFSGELDGLRIQRILTYANWAYPQAIEQGVSEAQQLNYLGDGYGSSGLSGAIGEYNTAGGGFTDQGAQGDITVQDIAASECGFLYVTSDGTLLFKERDSMFNVAAVGTFGDRDYPLNQQQTFSGTTTGLWTAFTGCTGVVSDGWSYDGTGSMLLTVDSGSPATVKARAEDIPAQAAGVSFWAMSPAGCTAQASIDWRESSGEIISSSYGSEVYCPPMTPVQVTMPVTAPVSGAALMDFGPQIVTNTAGTQLYVDRLRLSPGGFQVPYEGQVQPTEDLQYLYNDICVTRNVDQATYRARDQASRTQFYPRVYLRTIYTATADPTAVVDCANWLLEQYAEPQVRIEQLVVDAASYPEAWPFVLGTDIGDTVNFTRNPVESAPVSGSFLVIGISVDWEAGKAEFTYTLAPSQNVQVMTLDDPVNGIVGGGPVLGW